MTSPVPIDTDTVPCRANPELHFPTATGPRREAQENRAKTVCRTGSNGHRCPLFDACLTEALHWDVVGVWGATNEKERDAIRKRTGVVPLPVVVSPYSLRAYRIRGEGAA